MAKVKIRKNKSHKFKLLWILILACAVIVSLIVFLSVEEFGSERGKNAEKFSAIDECSLVMGNLIHQMKNDADCRIRCRGECDVRGMDFVNHSFKEELGSCHSCDCYCI